MSDETRVDREALRFQAETRRTSFLSRRLAASPGESGRCDNGDGRGVGLLETADGELRWLCARCLAGDPEPTPRFGTIRPAVDALDYHLFYETDLTEHGYDGPQIHRLAESCAAALSAPHPQGAPPTCEVCCDDDPPRDRPATARTVVTWPAGRDEFLTCDECAKACYSDMVRGEQIATTKVTTTLIPAPHPQSGTERRRALTDAWQAVDRAIRPLGHGGGARNSPWNEGYERAKNEALNAIHALLAAAPAPTEAGEGE